MNNVKSTLRRNLLLSSRDSERHVLETHSLYASAYRNSRQPNAHYDILQIQRRLTAFGQGRAEAVQKLINLASSDADTTPSLCRSHAEVLLQCGELDGALNFAKKAVEKDDSDAAAWDTLGSVLVGRSALDEACACYTKALQLEPNFLSAANNIAVALERLGRLREAEGYYRSLLPKAPNSVEIKLNFSALLGKLGQYREALEIAQEILERDPLMVKCWILTSSLLANVARYTESLLSIERAISLAPEQLKLVTRRADILRQLGRGKEALAACGDVLDKLPNDPDALHERALILRSLNKPQQALKGLHVAQSSSPTPAIVAADRGWLLAELGRKDDAVEAFDEALALQGDLGAAWYGRSLLISSKPKDRDIQLMEEILANKELMHRDRTHFSFALGKSYLDIGDGEKAFAHLRVGNQLKRSTFNYDWRLDAYHLKKMSAIFSTGSLSQSLRASLPSSRRPIFVFGMPRSGTTLVEQILCSHPLVSTIGESPIVGNLAKRAKIYMGAITNAESELVLQDLNILRRDYLEQTEADANGRLYFVDKMPSNFLHLGLISLMLPEARMIHCRRDPFDTCLSCYATLFTNGHEYSYDLSELGHYYSFYHDQMTCWEQVLPRGSVLDVNYELLVEDTESQIRRILEFCGLNWDASCLRFYETKRHVKTASFNQVRSPIYKTSVRRAEAFRLWLNDLERALSVGPGRC